MTVKNKTRFGLTERDIKTISDVFKKYPVVTDVCVFGSRAKATSKPASDIDMAVMNEGVADKTIMAIKSDLEDSTLPYKVDVINYPTLNHSELKDHIKRVGVLFYKSPEVI